MMLFVEKIQAIDWANLEDPWAEDVKNYLIKLVDATDPEEIRKWSRNVISIVCNWEGVYDCSLVTCELLLEFIQADDERVTKFCLHILEYLNFPFYIDGTTPKDHRNTRISLLIYLKRLNSFDLLSSFLHSNDPMMRRSCIRILNGFVLDPHRALEILLPHLSNESDARNRHIMMKGIFSLSLSAEGKKAAQHFDVCGNVIKFIHDPDPLVRCYVLLTGLWLSKETSSLPYGALLVDEFAQFTEFDDQRYGIPNLTSHIAAYVQASGTVESCEILEQLATNAGTTYLRDTFMIMKENITKC